jgi:hypothetical protein
MSTTKKFSPLFDALNYSSLVEKINILETVCSICRKKCSTEQYTEIDNQSSKIVLKLCKTCENRADVKDNWIKTTFLE